MSGQRCGVETFSSSVCFPGSLGPTFTHKGQKTWWGFPSDSGKSGTTTTYFFPVLVPVDATVETFPLLQSCYQKPSNQFFLFCSLSPFCLQCVPPTEVNVNSSTEISPGPSWYVVSSLRASGSYAGPLVVHDVFAVLQTQASFFEVCHSLLWCVHQSTGYSNTWKPREKRERNIECIYIFI